MDARLAPLCDPHLVAARRRRAGHRQQRQQMSDTRTRRDKDAHAVQCGGSARASVR